jgi:hypothetical protein
MAYQKDHISSIRERLQHGKLSPEDVKFVDELLRGAEELSSLATGEGGKRVIARLPFGMDVVK